MQSLRIETRQELQARILPSFLPTSKKRTHETIFLYAKKNSASNTTAFT